MNGGRLKHLAGDRSGATALEFAIVAPVFIALLLGVFNFGYALYCGAAVRHAIQQSSRTLMFNPSTTAAVLKSTAVGKLVAVPVNNLAITIVTETITANEQIKRVNWTYDYMVYVPGMPSQSLQMGSSLVVPLPPSN